MPSPHTSNGTFSINLPGADLLEATDWSRIAPLLFTFPDKGYWRLGDHVAEAWSIGKKYKPL